MHVKCKELTEQWPDLKAEFLEFEHSIICPFCHAEIPLLWVGIGWHVQGWQSKEGHGTDRHFLILKKKSKCMSLEAVVVFGNLGNHIAIKSKGSAVISDTTHGKTNCFSTGDGP